MGSVHGDDNALYAGKHLKCIEFFAEDVYKRQVLQQSFRFAVSPKQYITFNPMQYIKLKIQSDEVDLFSEDVYKRQVPCSPNQSRSQ